MPVSTCDDVQVDASLSLTLHQLASAQPWSASMVAQFAQTGIYALPICLLVVWLVARAPDDQRREVILSGALTALLAFAIGLVLERTLHRPRPFAEFGFDPLLAHAQDSSFPSDHTLIGVALVGPLAWRDPRIGVVLLAEALIVGFARVAAGLHYPSDIAGSAILALALDALVWLAIAPVLRRLNLRRWDESLLRSPPGAPPQ